LASVQRLVVVQCFRSGELVAAGGVVKAMKVYYQGEAGGEGSKKPFHIFKNMPKALPRQVKLRKGMVVATFKGMSESRGLEAFLEL
tara:strand:- start:10904 stop:11161 length:258 start_codon:yes stop_codon:yes gene_type:complete